MSTVVAGGAKGIAVGDRIVWSVTVSCGRCGRCRSGLTAKCASLRKVGHERFDGDWPLSGAYAEHVVLPAGTALAKVPDIMPDAVAAPAACATATVMAAMEAAGTVAGRRVLVIGAGMLGLTACAALGEAGARVRVTDIDAERLEVVGRFGGTPDGGGSVDAAIDFSGSSAAIGSAYGRLCVGGVLALAGSVLPGPRIEVSPETMVRQCLTITGVHNYEPRHLNSRREVPGAHTRGVSVAHAGRRPGRVGRHRVGADAGTRGQAARRHQALARTRSYGPFGP